MTSRIRRHLSSLGVVASLVIGSAAITSTASAEPLLRGFGGPDDFGADRLPENDDGSTGEIDISAAFPEGLFFFGQSFSSLYVNNNGNVSFGGPNGTFTPSAFPIAEQRMIAAWWGDVDTRGGWIPGAKNGVYWSTSPGRFVATWHNVGYYGSHDDLQNDFQLALIAAGPGVGDFNVEFRYNRCEWTTGDASGGMGGFGGTPAQAGFDAGNSRDYTALPGSLTREILRVCVTSNVGVPGLWRFEIRGGDVMCPGRGESCVTGLLGACSAGTRRCISVTESTCTANAMPMPETCNSIDDNCDGATDEALGETTCGVGECVATTSNCVAGVPQTCTPRPPGIETCNLLDDDCNGEVDNVEMQFCGTGACQATAPGCVEGSVPMCTPLEGSPEVCNGLDDDCNGRDDDGLDACIPPDAGPPDSGIPRDSGLDACSGLRCNPYRLQGRAGPIGNCGCSVPYSTRGSTAALAFGIAMIGLIALRRRRSN
jgi:MYXO-CTERM domain-containing protein